MQPGAGFQLVVGRPPVPKQLGNPAISARRLSRDEQPPLRPPRRPPYALVTFAALGAASMGAAIASLWSQRNGRLAAALGFYGAFFLGNALSFLYTTRRGSFQAWDEVLDDLRLHGDERVLDMGCGRGASSPPSPGD